MFRLSVAGAQHVITVVSGRLVISLLPIATVYRVLRVFLLLPVGFRLSVTGGTTCH